MHTAITPDQLFKNLADETRARILLLLAGEGELCVCELICALQASQPKVSRHLALLRKSGLLCDRRQGQWVYYRLNPDLPNWIVELLVLSERANPDWLAPEQRRLQAMGDRPERKASCC